MKPCSPLPLVMMLAAATLASAQVPDSWVGKRVFTQYGAVLKVGNTVVDDKGRTDNLTTAGKDRGVQRTYRVEQVNGEWLWLKDEKRGVAGWVQSKWVIPYDQAIDFYTSQIRANPCSSNYNSRATIWLEKGEYDIAIADLNEAIRLDPSSESAYSNRGNAWSDKKDYDRAIADYGEAIRLDPKYALAYLNRGIARKNKRDYDRAIADYGEAIRLDPKDLYAHNERAWVWATCPDAKFRDGKKAVESATKACELSDWKDRGCLDTLAASYAEAGDFGQAVEWEEKAIALTPESEAEELKVRNERLALYRDGKPYREP